MKEVICPLCKHDKYFVLEDYSIKELSTSWKNSFKFNPFTASNTSDYFYKVQCINCSLVFYNPSYYGDSDFYKKLSKFEWYYEKEKWEFNEALKIIIDSKPKKLLEIGCGKGVFLEKIKNAIDYLGIDINEDAINYCKEKGLNANTISIDHINDKYDCIVMFEVLEHLDDFSAFFDKIDNLLDQNGTFIIAVPNPDSYLKLMTKPLLDLPPHHSSSWGFQTFEFLAKKYNYTISNYLIEPLRSVHHADYLNSKFQNYNDIPLNYDTFKSKILNRIRNFIFSALKPIDNKLKRLEKLDYLLYILDKEKIKGQTHLITFKK